MFFVLSKVFWFLAQPSSLCALVLFIGIALSFWQRFARLGRRMALTGFALLLIAGLSPLANAAILPLENRIARAQIKPGEPVHGIIILGGLENGRVSLARGTLAINEAAERMTEAVILARRHPGAKILFSGGAGSVFREHLPGAASIVDYLREAGIANGRLLVEDRSRNTYENALFSKAAAKPKPGERWLLVTSAFHMSRSLGCFRKVGFDVAPWPVDYRTKDAGDLLRPFDSIGKGLRRLDTAAKEWIGLIAYYAADRTSALFPK